MKIKWKFKWLLKLYEGTDVSEMFRINAGRNIHEKRSEGKQAPKLWLKMRYDSFEIVCSTLNDFASSFRDQKVESGGNQVSLEDSREARFWENLESFFVRESEHVIVNSC